MKIKLALVASLLLILVGCGSKYPVSDGVYVSKKNPNKKNAWLLVSTKKVTVGEEEKEYLNFKSLAKEERSITIGDENKQEYGSYKVTKKSDTEILNLVLKLGDDTFTIGSNEFIKSKMSAEEAKELIKN
jgi:hypothetical protein